MSLPYLHRVTGPGYASPEEAFNNGDRERLLYVTCVQPTKTSADYLAIVDVDPDSEQYSQVVHRTYMPNVADELHHSGWNACSSCHNDCSKIRDKLILPCLNSNRIYVLQMNERQSSIIKTIESHQLSRLNLSAPHTSHCLPNGHIMISCMGDAHGNNQGSFLILDGRSFHPSGVWNQQSVKYGYDFWYQPRLDILVSSEWSAPNTFRQGFLSKQKQEESNFENHYGHSIHLWQFSTGQLLKSVDLRSTGKPACMPLEIRFLHDPNSCVGFVGCAYSSNVFRFCYDQAEQDLLVEEVISIKPKKVNGFSGGEWLPGFITDIIISMNDQYLFVSAWAFGEIRQYSGINNAHLYMLAKIRIGGMLSPIYSLSIVQDDEPVENRHVHYEIKGIILRGGAQMLQLSLDGRRLYVTNSLYSAWDRQLYPQMFEYGSQLVKVHINNKDDEHQSTELLVDKTFMVDFGSEPNGPVLAHEMRYPGGDCTSDIWI